MLPELFRKRECVFWEEDDLQLNARNCRCGRGLGRDEELDKTNDRSRYTLLDSAIEHEGAARVCNFARGEEHRLFSRQSKLLFADMSELEIAATLRISRR